MSSSYVNELHTAIEAVQAAGIYLRESLGLVSAETVIYKGAIDIVTIHDIRAQQIIIETLSRVFPNYSYLTEEEQDVSKIAGSGWRWILDPLDGTSNYAHGYPHFCVSLALEVSGQIELGVVYAPIFDEMFTSVRGEGALLGGNPIHPSSTSRLTDSIMATGFPYDQEHNLQSCFDGLRRIAPAIRSPRVLGAAALDICYVASGRLDAYWDVELAPWDMAAATLIVREAGGQVTDVKGAAFDHLGPTVIASNGILHAAIREVLNGH
jgi:myo-inositol-1(or 4)-monophosphatase